MAANNDFCCPQNNIKLFKFKKKKEIKNKKQFPNKRTYDKVTLTPTAFLNSVGKIYKFLYNFPIKNSVKQKEILQKWKPFRTKNLTTGVVKLFLNINKILPLKEEKSICVMIPCIYDIIPGAFIVAEFSAKHFYTLHLTLCICL